MRAVTKMSDSDLRHRLYHAVNMLISAGKMSLFSFVCVCDLWTLTKQQILALPHCVILSDCKTINNKYLNKPVKTPLPTLSVLHITYNSYNSVMSLVKSRSD